LVSLNYTHDDQLCGLRKQLARKEIVKGKQQARELHGCKCDECHDHPRSETAREHRAINWILLTLNEKNRRRFGGVLALQLGHGGVQQVRRITGLSRTTILRGRNEIQIREGKNRASQIREPGGGRHKAEKNNLGS
jgi:hypothetical protein